MVVYTSASKARVRREAVEIDGRITEEEVFLLLKRYSVKRFGVLFAGPECLAIMKLRAAVTRKQNQETKMRVDITDVDACLRLLLSKGISLDDPQLRLLCTHEDVHNFITLIQLSQVPQPLLRGICGVAWPHSLATAPLCQLVRTPEPISGAH